MGCGKALRQGQTWEGQGKGRWGAGELCPQGEGWGSWAPTPDCRSGLAVTGLDWAQRAEVPGTSLRLWLPTQSQVLAQSWCMWASLCV